MSTQPVDDGARRYFRRVAATLDDTVDAVAARIARRFGWDKPGHIATYRGYAHATGCELTGRVLARASHRAAAADHDWWDNLRGTWERFESDDLGHVPLRVSFRGTTHDVTTDAEGYYTLAIPLDAPRGTSLWDNATVTLADGGLPTVQPVQCVPATAHFGLISDIDDTVLVSGITDWKLATRLVLLGNARTREPLRGAPQLYRALQAGVPGAGPNPVYYVSSSPWNLYELLDEFFALNELPSGPIFLRDYGVDADRFIASPGHGHKLERILMLIDRHPSLQWVLVGDSGQADAELYAEAARHHPDRVLAVYIRDVDPDVESPYDAGVDAHIGKLGVGVPMLRVRDSLAIAQHAHALGLIPREAVDDVAIAVTQRKL